MWWCGIVAMKNVAYATCCVIVVWCQMWKIMQCVRCGGVMRCGLLWCEICCCWMWVWCGIVVDVEWCEMWTEAVWCGTRSALICSMKWCCPGRLQCNVFRCWIWWSEARCVATLTVCEMWRGSLVCSNVMWNVVQWWCDVEWCGVEWCDAKGGVM